MNYLSNKGNQDKSLIFLHGNSSSSKVFAEFVEKCPYDYKAIAIDLPGHGENKKSGNVDDYLLQVTLNEVTEFINSFAGDKILVGNSLGGHVAIEIANNIKNLKGLVIFGTPPVKKPLNLEEAFAENPATPLFFQEEPDRKEFEKIIGVASTKENTHDFLVNDFFNTDPKVRVALAKNVEHDSFQDESEIFKNLNIPKLILQGDKEPLVNYEYIKEIVKESGAKLIEIEDCAHYISVEQPKVFNEIILKFAEECFRKS